MGRTCLFGDVLSVHLVFLLQLRLVFIASATLLCNVFTSTFYLVLQLNDAVLVVLR
jgi:hypothetical protein